MSRQGVWYQWINPLGGYGDKMWPSEYSFNTEVCHAVSQRDLFESRPMRRATERSKRWRETNAINPCLGAIAEDEVILGWER